MPEAAKTKVKRSKLATFIDTTKGSDSPTWALIGDGVTEQTITYILRIHREYPHLLQNV